MDRATLAALDRAALVDLVLRLVAEQTNRMAALEARIAALERENAELKARLGRDSRNSSRPPSSDPPGSRPKPRGEPGQRRPGGQPGHPGHHRPLLPPEQVDRLVVLRPVHCANCGAPLAPEPAADDPAAERVQVTEVPPMAVQVTEYRLEARGCGRCGAVTRAERPAGAGGGRFGPRLQALVAVLSGRYRLSRREVVRVLADLWGVELALGTVVELEQATSAALGPVVDEALGAARQAKAANMDETGWREGRQRAWLWVLVTAWVTVFRIAPRRAGTVAKELLGPAWRGIVGSDRFSGYAWLPVPWRQVCWAHLRRDFQALVDRGGGAAPIGTAALAIEREVFVLWHRFTRGEGDRAALRRELEPLQARLWRVFADGINSDDPKAAALCWDLGSRLWPALWSFARYEGVEPTNNAAERALRPAVLWRKGTFGCHSPAGSRFAERLLTVTATCRQQGRNPVEFLVAANQAARLRTPPPSLLPAQAG